jgi:hypothetical protein
LKILYLKHVEAFIAVWNTYILDSLPFIPSTCLVKMKLPVFYLCFIFSSEYYPSRIAGISMFYYHLLLYITIFIYYWFWFHSHCLWELRLQVYIVWQPYPFSLSFCFKIQIEWLTGGECIAGMHEVVATNRTIDAINLAKEQKRSLWRVSSTVSAHKKRVVYFTRKK